MANTNDIDTDADQGDDKTQKLSVQLNEAFERLEKQRDEGQPANDRSQDIETQEKSSPLNALAMMIGLVALGLASYATFIAHQAVVPPPQAPAETGLLDRLTAMEQSIRDNAAGVNDYRARLDSLSTELANASGADTAGLNEFESRIESRVAEIQARIGTTSQDWLLAEVEYLLRLGNQRILMEGDARGAATLFRAADDIVREAEGIAAFGLREAIAKDLAALDAVPQVDADGIFVRLSALEGQVGQLQRRQQVFVPGTVSPVVVDGEAVTFGQRVQDFLTHLGARLASLVDYRRDGETVTPILPPKEEYYLRQNLVLKLQIAQLGLLRSDQAVYEGSIEEAQGWVQQHFDPGHAVTVSMLAALADLATVRIERQRPDVTGSLREVRKVLARFHAPAREDSSP